MIFRNTNYRGSVAPKDFSHLLVARPGEPLNILPQKMGESLCKVQEDFLGIACLDASAKFIGFRGDRGDGALAFGLVLRLRLRLRKAIGDNPDKAFADVCRARYRGAGVPSRDSRLDLIDQLLGHFRSQTILNSHGLHAFISGRGSQRGGLLGIPFRKALPA